MARPGKLDQRITFKAQALAADGIGGSVMSYGDISTVPTVWARVTPSSGKEISAEGRVVADGMFKFTIRNRSDIDETHVIFWGGETYNIRNVRRSGTRSMYLEIDAERGVAT